jgi:ribosomal protein S18 acetylase RimI-like enzyme
MTPVAAAAPPKAKAPPKHSTIFLRNVPVHGPYADERVAALVLQTRKLSEAAFDEDCLEKVTKKSHWKLTLLASEDLTLLCGYLVAKVVNGFLSIAKLAVPEEFRGCGFGRKIIEDATKEAKKRGDVYEMGMSSLAEAVPFYKRLGFKAYPGLKIHTEADVVEGQVFMDKRLRPRPRQRR